MSQPRQPTPAQSPTPSKSSLRRTSSAQNPSQRSLIPPPSPRFEDLPPATVRYSPRSPPNQTLEYESEEDDDEPLIYPDVPAAPGEESSLPHPDPERPFQPFFTLIEDGLTLEHHHPSVYYIFADDNAEIVTEAALRSLEQNEPVGESSTSGDPTTAQQSELDSHLQSESRLPPPTEGIREHYLVVDVQPISPAQAQQQRVREQAQGQTAHSLSQNTMSQPDLLPSYAVTGFTSFSPDWQVTSASISSAPTMGDVPGNDEGLMLHIEGRGLPALDDVDNVPTRAGKAVVAEHGGGSGEDKDDGSGTASQKETLEDMIERFQSQLRDVKRLVEMENGPTNPYRGVGPSGGGDGAGDNAGQGEVENSQDLTGIGLEEQD